jgi:hypothetical protein
LQKSLPVMGASDTIKLSWSNGGGNVAKC